MAERLFEIPEIPLLREPRRRKGAAGSVSDARFTNDYPPEWNRCPTCEGWGYRWSRDLGNSFAYPPMMLAPDDPRLAVRFGVADDRPGEWEKVSCGDCFGMGSLKARVRLEAGHRCIRCQHPYIPKGDAKMLGVEPTPFHWSPCGEHCTHPGPIRYRFASEDWCDFGALAEDGWLDTRAQSSLREVGAQVEAEWRILTVHHLDGDKANVRWWNLAALCQRCHLEIQAKIVMERVYPHEHSAWFRPYVAGYYAFVYLGLELTRPETEARMDELLMLELAA